MYNSAMDAINAAYNATGQTTAVDLVNDHLCEIHIGVFEILYLIMYSLLIVVAVLGNGIVIYIIVSDIRMRTVTNLFLINLATADITKALICVPFSFTANLIYNYWPFGPFMCPFVTYMQAVTVFASAFTMVAMSIDRYIAILHPLRPKMTHRGVCLVLLLMWILAGIVPLPTAIMSNKAPPPYHNGTEECLRDICDEIWPEIAMRTSYSLAIMLLQYFIPLAVLAFTYGRIGYIIWIKKTPGEAVQTRDERMASSKRKMVKMMIVVVLVYAVCWFPLHAIQLIGDTNSTIYDTENFNLVWNAFVWLAMSHACYNPVVYVWMNRRFRRGFHKIFRICLCCKLHSSPKRPSGTELTMTVNLRNGDTCRQSL